MPVNNFSVGRDIALDIQTPTGPLIIKGITGFSSKPDTVDAKSKGLDGVTSHAIFPDGWTGQFDIDRTDATVDKYFATLESNYYAGQNQLPATITETIQEADGSISQYRYINVMLKLDDAGEWRGDQITKQKVSFMASQRVPTT